MKIIEELLQRWEIEFKKGFAKPLILLTLSMGSNYPYSITREINTKTEGNISIAGSNIYPLLNTLKEQGLVISEKVLKDPSNENSQMRTVYSLSALGHEFLEELRNSLGTFMQMMEKLLNQEV